MGGTLSKKEKALLGLFHRLPGSQGFVARPVASSLDTMPMRPPLATDKRATPPPERGAPCQP